jgi:putative DNA primase/helicase
MNKTTWLRSFQCGRISARFVNISEPDKRLTLSAALLKTLTGSDTVNARFLHENSFDFKPQFKIFTNTNYLPTVTDLTLLTSGRVKIIPFERHFEEFDGTSPEDILRRKPQRISTGSEGYANLRRSALIWPHRQDATLPTTGKTTGRTLQRKRLARWKL